MRLKVRLYLQPFSHYNILQEKWHSIIIHVRIKNSIINQPNLKRHKIYNELYGNDILIEISRTVLKFQIKPKRYKITIMKNLLIVKRYLLKAVVVKGENFEATVPGNVLMFDFEIPF